MLAEFTYFSLSHSIDDILKETPVLFFIPLFRRQTVENKIYKFSYILQEISFSSADCKPAGVPWEK